MKNACLALVILVSLPSAFASHAPAGRCDSNGAPALGIVEVSGGSADTTFYVYDDGRGLPEVWQESNGIWVAGGDPHHNLQRGGGASPIIPDDPEVCPEDPTVPPDSRIL